MAKKDIPEEAFEKGNEEVILLDSEENASEASRPEPSDEAAPRVRMKYTDPGPYGNEFLTSHSITKDDVRNIMTAAGEDEATIKEAVRTHTDLVWSKDNNFTAYVDGLHPTVRERLENEKAWKTV